jgi:hypothetical protein
MNYNLLKKSHLIPLCTTMSLFVMLSISSDGGASTVHANTGEVPHIIYDGDIGGDPCDYNTIAILLNSHKRGMIDLMGMVAAPPDDYPVPIFDISNQIHETSVPLATYKKYNSDDPGADFFEKRVRALYGILLRSVNYAVFQNKYMYEKYGNDSTKLACQVLPSLEFYRKTLSEAEDKSVIIYAPGQLFNWALTIFFKTR